MSTCADRVVAVHDRADRLVHDAGGERTARGGRRARPATARSVDVVRADDDDRRARRAGERALHRLVASARSAGCAAGRRSRAASGACRTPAARARRAPPPSRPPRSPDGAATGAGPHPRCATPARSPLRRCSSVRRSVRCRRTRGSRRSTRTIPAASTASTPRSIAVAELAEQRRQHGQRADHRHEHDDHRADRRAT